jgi:RNA polymerase sigma factor (TIGR02999 family)
MAAPNATTEITELLQQWRDGSREAEDLLFRAVLPNLKRLAQYMMRRERKGHTLEATELVDQAYLRLVAAKDRDWRSRGHFFAIAARTMRRHLIDHARGRPDVEFISLDGMENTIFKDAAKTETALTVDRLLEQLAVEHPDWCRVVELKYFLGLTDDEAADALGIKLRTFQRMWSDARQWLFTRMK